MERLSDEVDDLVAAWRAQRPDLDVEPMQVLSRISRLAKHLDIARRSAFASQGLQSWEFDVLSALRRQGPPFRLTPGSLLRATLVTSGTMTNRIDRLAAAGLVRRAPDPTDRRGVLVMLTDEGKERVDAALHGLLQRERALLASLSQGQQADLAALLRALLAPFDAAPAGRPSLLVLVFRYWSNEKPKQSWHDTSLGEGCVTGRGWSPRRRASGPRGPICPPGAGAAPCRAT